MQNQLGKLYVVATPIGNLADFSGRAKQILADVDLIAAEDTRHISQLLQHYGISNKLQSLHLHNEDKVSVQLVERLLKGESIALVSDAGTPLLSDPGMPLVKLAKDSGIEVSPIPGACAVIAALSASGLAINQFSFEGFLPRTSSARLAFFETKKDAPSTWVFYESKHRIIATIKDLVLILPNDRLIVIAREMTKLYETIKRLPLSEALAFFENDKNQCKGEFVIIIDAAPKKITPQQLSDEQLRILTLLLEECSLKTAVALAVKITAVKKKILYQAALNLSADKR